MSNNLKKLLLGLVLFTGLVTVFSCRKEISNIFESEAVKETQWAKDYFNNVLLRNSGNKVSYKNLNQIAVAGGIDKTPNMKIPLWGLARASQTKLFTFVEIPLRYSQRVLRSYGKEGDKEDAELAKGSFDRLVIYKNKNGEINQRIISYIPSKEYLERHNGDISHNKIESLDKDFSGFLRYSDWDGNVLSRLYINDGKARKLKQKQSSAIIKTNNAGNEVATVKQKPGGGNKVDAWVEVCRDIIEYEWTQTCHYDSPDDPIPRYCDEPILVSSTVIGEECWEEYVYDPNDCSDPANFDNPDCQPSGGEEDECPDISSSLDAIKKTGESYETCASVPGNSLAFTDLSAFRNAIDSQTFSIESVTSSGDEKSIPFKVTTTIYGGVLFKVKIKKNTSNIYEVIEITSDQWGNSFSWSWQQGSHTTNVSSNIIILEVSGTEKWNLFLQSVGTIWSIPRNYRMNIDKTTGQPISFVKLN